ncbi:MAG TPA: peptidoglycan DD-metalloendopeptidase family protein [Candidatus Paceibacterota bacterium]|nr:peptidoglycan DD-metalloendopeptidase family protein [Candidatus Paceibacterota bacterium]
MQALKKKQIAVALALSAMVIFVCLKGSATMVSADTSADIQAKIDDNNQKIQALQKEIDQYSSLLDSTSKQAQTLKNALSQLELSQKKLEANLALTTKNISKTSLTLSDLSRQIADTETKIGSTSEQISTIIRETQYAESQSAIENFLNNKSLSATWDYINAIHALQSQVKGKYDDLKELEDLLHAKEDEARGQKTKLEQYQKTLSDQKEVVLATKDAKSKLLADTNGREANYRAILAQKTAEEAAYEKELYAYESQLKITITPNEVPNAIHGLLSWPLDSIRITQYFGRTVSAKRLYVSGTHGGVDFAASIGTPVRAALSGVVADTEPSKSRSGCQYGKYVLIKHPNGLSTIYGHLSYVSVKPGDTVITGDVIGYSGDTGYATGPHLHLGLYVTAGIRVVDSSQLGSKNCAGIKTVAAPPTAYLDPMAYLPAL